MTSRWIICAGIVISLAARLAYAQAPTDPTRELRRQEERTKAMREREEPTVDFASSVPKANQNRLALNETPCFVIRDVQLHVLSHSQTDHTPQTQETFAFQWALQAISGPNADDTPIGKCVGVQGIGLVLQRVQDSVIQRGFITTKVLAPAQELAKGILTLNVLPGHIGAIRFKTNEGVSAPPLYTLPIQPGAILNLRDIEQALENLKRVVELKRQHHRLA